MERIFSIVTLTTIIAFIIKVLNLINKISFKLECFLTRFLPKEPDTLVLSEQYRKFKVDPIPIIKTISLPITFEEAVESYKSKHKGKVPAPIKRRVPISFPVDTKCPHCSASSDYLFDNRSKNKSGQVRCKVCDTAFIPGKSYISQVAHYCPYCGRKLQPKHDRSGYTVYRCDSYTCSYYAYNLKSLSKEEKVLYKKNPSSFKLHYITRVFEASLDALEKLQHVVKPSTIDLSRIRYSKNTLGLILTYYINYGLSLRKTALIMREIHDISISHQTVANYAEAAAHLLEPWLNSYQYGELTTEQCGDETYVKVKGRKAYVFFMCDSVKKIITSWNIFLKRDTFSAIQTYYSVLRKFKEIPKNLKFVVDGNPIYIAAQQYFQLHGIHFDVFQVIGLKDLNDTAKTYRPAKQIIERLNRTFQFSYYVKNGFKSIEKANEFMCRFTVYFNFLRKHKALGYNPPVILKEFSGITNMPNKWNILLQKALSEIQLES